MAFAALAAEQKVQGGATNALKYNM